MFVEDLESDGGASLVQGVVGDVLGGGAVLGHVELLAVAPEGVRFLAVLGVVADEEVLVAHAERDDEPDGDEDDARHHHVPADDEERGHQLLAQLLPAHAAVERPLQVEHGQEVVAQRRLREAPGQKPPQKPRHCVRVEHAQRIIHPLQQLRPLVQHHHREPRHRARKHAHQDRRPPLHQP
jgi:hypothetical protein